MRSRRHQQAVPVPVVYSFRFSHHGAYSSYHRLVDYLRPECTVVDIPFGWKILRKSERIARFWRRANEYRLRKFFRAEDVASIHYLYPENTMFQGLHWAKRNNVVLTWHQPLSYLDQLPPSIREQSRSILQKSAAVIFLSSEARNQYEKAIGLRKSFVIKHGVDVEFFRFRERQQPKSKLTVITVGNWLRDHRCWAQTVELLLQRKANMEFKVLCNCDNMSRYKRCLQLQSDRITFGNGLSDEELRSFYGDADIAFLPLVDATANNSLVECMASGVPCVVSDLAATREYANDTALYFDNRNPQEAAERLTSLALHNELRKELAAAARSKAECELSWPVVAAKHAAIYHQVGADS